MNQIFHYRKEI